MFEVVDKTYAKCNICKSKLSYKTSLTNLKKHIQNRHLSVKLRAQKRHAMQTTTSVIQTPTDSEIEIDTARGTSRQMVTVAEGMMQHSINSLRQTTIPSGFKKTKLSTKTRKEIDDALSMLFIKDLQPFSIVEDVGFREFVKALNPEYQLPSRHAISNTIISVVYETCIAQMREKISEGAKFCITTDCWTSHSSISYMAVTAHFVNSKFDMCSILLECCPMTESHTTKNVSAELMRVTEDWGISRKILLAITDNASNMKNAIQNDLKWHHFGCFAQTLNLIVENALSYEQVCITLQKVKQIVTHFRKSVAANEQFLTFQRNAGEQPIKLFPKSIETSWNSTLNMIERFVRVEDAVKSTVAHIDKALPIISADDWLLLKHLVAILKPFEHATIEISEHKYCSAAVVIPIVNGLLQVLTELSIDYTYPALSKTVISALLSGLTERLGNVEKNNILTMATFLDPHFKTFAFSEPSVADTVKNRITEEVSRVAQTQQQKEQLIVPTPSVSELSIRTKLYTNIATNVPKSSSISKAISEVQRYLEDEIIARTEDTLQWWKKNTNKYPYLSLIAREKLGCLASCVPCERLFSSAGMIISERRTLLEDEKAKMLIFLNANIKNMS
uniref:Zinc finger BED domain-containing protein 1 n=1 Tax=Zeugodacus cucurbitae TaxID=28588 RepID=A0A0A1XSV1_ZEUCU